MPTFDNDTFLRALKRESTPRTPVWLMRQAGRYLPEYNATRAKAGSFLALAKTPSLATEVTLQPLERFALDAAILFSDILTVPDAMGLGLHFAEGEGPRFTHTTADEATIGELAVPDMAKLAYVFDAVREIKRALKRSVPLIGFAGSPFTLACYMIEGGGQRRLRRGAANGVCPTRSARPPGRHQCEGRRSVFERADCRGRRCGDDLRHLGRIAVDCGVPDILAVVDAGGAGRTRARSGRQRRADDRLHQGGRSMAGRHRRLRCGGGRTRLDR